MTTIPTATARILQELLLLMTMVSTTTTRTVRINDRARREDRDPDGGSNDDDHDAATTMPTGDDDHDGDAKQINLTRLSLVRQSRAHENLKSATPGRDISNASSFASGGWESDNSSRDTGTWCRPPSHCHT